MDVLAIVTARGGSKGLPRKNILSVGGRPLISWTIAAAKRSKFCNKVIVSTDSEEIKNVACEAGAEAPFLRPSELAQDSTPGIAPVLHAVEWCEQNNFCKPSIVVLLQPTSPLRNYTDIDTAIAMLKADEQTESVVSISESSKHPNWMRTLDSNGFIRDFISQSNLVSHRQSLQKVYALNGAVYAIRRDVLVNQKTFFPSRTKGYVMPPERSLDVDSAWDLKMVDLVLSASPK